MPKNDKLINSILAVAERNRSTHIAEAADKDTPQIYAALAISLYRLLDMPEKEKAEAINSIFVESQNIWLDCVNRGLDINQMCIDETEIDVIGGEK